LAASNIAFSVNSLVFLPMLGLNIGLSSLVGQAMGRGRVDEAERVTANTLRLAFVYMLPLALFIAVAAGPLMDIFAPGDMTPEAFAPVRSLGMKLLYFIAVYSLVDAGNIVYFGALKGAGDTLGIMYLLLGGLVFLLILPIVVLKQAGMATVINYWLVFTLYVMILAVGAMFRFHRRGWRRIRVVETSAGTPLQSPNRLVQGRNWSRPGPGGRGQSPHAIKSASTTEEPGRCPGPRRGK
ncbi:MAG: hypothetical protein LBH65_03940, partial [Desulfovibrio sp.]|nr:hypothetical protein [Desulfovibrio sp.]